MPIRVRIGSPSQPGAPRTDKSTAHPRRLRRRVWSAGRLLFVAGALAFTFGVFFLASMRVASKAREVKVPDLRGQPVERAREALAVAGLSLRVDPNRRPDPKVPAGHILTQEPDPGVVLRRQRGVRVRLSDGQREPVVPIVTGQTERSAEMLLTKEQITIGARAEIRSADYEQGAVVAQSPPAKNRAASVSLLINRGDGALAFVTPDVIGAPGGLAVSLLRTKGFRASIVAELPYPGIPAGIVIRQTPSAGFRIAPNEPISLEVSK
jgi:serine/threonine-protein kinase